MPDRRNTPRTRLKRTIRPLTVDFESESTKGSGTLRSVSMRGVLLEVDTSLEIGETVALTLRAPESIEFSGTIRSQRDGSPTLVFVEIDGGIDELTDLFERILVGED